MLNCININVQTNPCLCGSYPDMQKCWCSPWSRKRYFERLSRPLLSRIDICVEARNLSYADLTGKDKNECSKDIRSRVHRCHELQKERFQKESFRFNSQIPSSKMGKYCSLGEKQSAYMEHIFNKMELTGRTYHKILKVARTIADLDHEEDIQLKHLNEAVCYRTINEKYWGGIQ